MHELVARDDGSRGDGDVLFALVPLLKADLPSLFLQRVEDQPFVTELVRDRALASRHLFQEILQHLGVAPGEEAIEVVDPGVQLVVTLRPDGDDAVLAQDADVRGQLFDNPVGDLLAVTDVEGYEVFCHAGREVDGGDHQRAEVVALPRFVYPDPSQRGRHDVANVKLTLVPLPRSLSMTSSPPCACTKCLTIAKPRPVPPSSRDRALSIR